MRSKVNHPLFNLALCSCVTAKVCQATNSGVSEHLLRGRFTCFILAIFFGISKRSRQGILLPGPLRLVYRNEVGNKILILGY